MSVVFPAVPVRARAASIAVLGMLATGCGGPDEGPLELGGFANILSPLERGAWFNVGGCSRSKRDSGVDIMITSISPSRVSGARRSDIGALVAWPDGASASDVISAPGNPPDYYRPIADDTHVGGTLSGCSVSFAIVLPRAVDAPVEVHGFDVTYEAAGDTYTAHADVELAICPPGTKAGGGSRTCFG